MRTPLYGVFRNPKGFLIGRDVVKVLVHAPIVFSGTGVHRLALRMIYGEWRYLGNGEVKDISTGATVVADVKEVSRSYTKKITPLGRPIRWQAPTDHWIIEAEEGTFVLSATLFEELIFAPDGRFFLSIGGYDFELVPYAGESAVIKRQLLSDLPVGRPVTPTDRLGFTKFPHGEYALALVRDRFEFAAVKLIDTYVADAVFSEPAAQSLLRGKRGGRLTPQRPSRGLTI